MIVGNDVSRHQGDIDFGKYKDNTHFLIAKCTEGVGYLDPKFIRNRDHCRSLGIPFGTYHFARPDLGNTPEAEADYYVSKADPRQGELLVLDYEPDWNGDAVGWCHNFLRRVFEKTETKPLIYLNQSQTKKFNWTPVVNDGYGLWIAAYTYDPNNNNFESGEWEFAAMQQWTNRQQVPGISGGVDGNVFFGTIEQLKKYGYKGSTGPTPGPTPPSNSNELLRRVETVERNLEALTVRVGQLEKDLGVHLNAIKVNNQGLQEIRSKLQRIKEAL